MNSLDYGEYEHDFVKHPDPKSQDIYKCTRCGSKAGYEGWSMKRIFLIGKNSKKKVTHAIRKRYKSSVKLIHDSKVYKEQLVVSACVLVKKGNKAYKLNPWTGKILTTKGCLYSKNDMLVKEII